jgi:hypothetical protein
MDRRDEAVLSRGPGWEERRNERAEATARWQLRAFQMAALPLAQEVFGPQATVYLLPWGGRPPLAGGLTLQVPFRDLNDHRAREALFLALAARDPVLSGTPCVYVFQPETMPAETRTRLHPASTP